MFSPFTFLLDVDDAKLTGAIRSNGGSYSLEYSEKITHVILTNDDDVDWKKRARTYAVPVLKREFIAEAVKTRRVPNMNFYLITPRDYILSTPKRGPFEGFVFHMSNQEHKSPLVKNIFHNGGTVIDSNSVIQNLEKIDEILDSNFMVTFFVLDTPCWKFLLNGEVFNTKVLEFLMTNGIQMVRKEWLIECVKAKRIISFQDSRYQIRKKDIIEMFSQVLDQVRSCLHRSTDLNRNLPKFSVSTRISLTKDFNVNAVMLFRRVYELESLGFLSLRVQFLIFEFMIELMVVSSCYVHDKKFRKVQGEEGYLFTLRMIYRTQIIKNIIEFLKKSVKMIERRKKMFFRFLNLIVFDHVRNLDLKMYILENLVLFLNETHELRNIHHVVILKLLQSEEFVSTFSHDHSTGSMSGDMSPGSITTQDNVILNFIRKKLISSRKMESVMERTFANAIHNVPLIRKLIRYKLVDQLQNRSILVEILLIQVHKYAQFILRNLGKIEKNQKSSRMGRKKRRMKKRRKKKKKSRTSPLFYDEDEDDDNEEDTDDDDDDDSEDYPGEYVAGGEDFHSFLLDILFSKLLMSLSEQLEKMRLTSIIFIHLHLFDEKKLVHFDELVFELIGREKYEITFFDNFTDRQILLVKHYLKLMYYTRMRVFKGKDKIGIVKKFLKFRKEFEETFFASSRKRWKKRDIGDDRKGSSFGSHHQKDSNSVIEEIKHKKVFRVNEKMVRANVRNTMYPDDGLNIVAITEKQTNYEKQKELSQKYPELYRFEDDEEEEDEEEILEDDDEEREKKKKKKKNRSISVKTDFKNPVIFTEDDFDAKRTFVHIGLKEVVFGLVQKECYKCHSRIHPRIKCSRCERVMCKECFNAYFDEDAWEKFLFDQTFGCTECNQKKRKIRQIYDDDEEIDEDRLHKKRKLD